MRFTFLSHFESSQFVASVSLFSSDFESSRFVTFRIKLGTPIGFCGLTLDGSLYDPDTLSRTSLRPDAQNGNKYTFYTMPT